MSPGIFILFLCLFAQLERKYEFLFASSFFKKKVKNEEGKFILIILLKVPQDHKCYASSKFESISGLRIKISSKTHTPVDYVDFDDLKNHPKYIGKIETMLAEV